MSLSSGARLGPYEILSVVGVGGMGEVYRARDTRLDRTVAIKVLPSSDPELKLRFAREARVIAGLTHPHICTLYDVGHQAGVDFLVMEYLEGQTLADRLKSGPLPFGETVQHAIGLAGALDRAHRAGVVHRDVKPGNIVLTPGGPKLLDFGVAKLRPQDVPGGVDATMTASGSLTGAGSVVGTPRYMAPEQLEGREADMRSDLFALGAVLYEMVTGRKAFAGDTAARVVAGIMSVEPAFEDLRRLSSPAFEHLVKNCLAKDPAQRWQAAFDVLLALEWVGAESGRQHPSGVPQTNTRWRWIAAAGLAAAAAVAAAMNAVLRTQEPNPPMNLALLPPGTEGENTFPVLAPDGHRVAFAAQTPAGEVVLWVRPLDTSYPLAIAGTRGAAYPFWSPDGRAVGFFADGKLKVVSGIEGASSAVQTLADAPDPRGGTWGADNHIVFARNIEDGLYRVPIAGGDVTRVTTLDRGRQENSHRWPQFLPDGRRLIFLARSAASEHQGIYAGTPGADDWRLLLRTPVSALVTAVGPASLLWPFGARSDYLLYVRDETLFAHRIDVEALQLVGEPQAVVDSVAVRINRGVFSAARRSLLYRIANTEGRRFFWVGRDGTLQGTAASMAGSSPRVSTDGGQVALVRVDPSSGAGDIWLEDVSRRVLTRFTSHPAYDWTPVWSPDGSSIAFASNREGPMDLYVKPVDGSEPERLLRKSDERKVPTDWSRDGAFLLYQQEDPTRGWDIWSLALNDELTAFPVLSSEFNETQGTLSPDGRWLAYTSDDTGEEQVYVQQVPDAMRPRSSSELRGGKTRVSADGGSQPRWRSDGKELFYVNRNRKLMAAEVVPGAQFNVGRGIPLLRVAVNHYDVTPDGTQFLVATTADTERPSPLNLLLNWTEVLTK